MYWSRVAVAVTVFFLFIVVTPSSIVIVCSACFSPVQQVSSAAVNEYASVPVLSCSIVRLAVL